MQKLLLTLFLAIAILIPTVQAQAADVPNFRRVAGDYVSGGERTHHDKKKMFCYSYECSTDLRQNFAEQYINLLRQRGILLVDHEENDWRATSAHYLDIWYFTYKGEKIEFWQYKYFDEGRISFTVRVADALTYEGR